MNDYWLEAKAKCSAEILVALEKAWKLVADFKEPVIFVHEDMCEFKWPDAVMYTFPVNRNIYLLYKGKFESVEEEEFLAAIK